MRAGKFELVQAVKAHAAANYEKDGWDYIVECYGDAEIGEVIGNARTVKGAIKKVRATVKTMDSVRKDVQAEIF